MRRSNYDLSTALVGIGAIAVLISLFLTWYSPGQTAFDVFELTDWLLVALAVGALVVIGLESWSGGGEPSNRLAWICGALAFVVIAQVIDPPPAAGGEEREIGAWVALAGAVLMVAGAVMALAQISVTIDVTERDRRRRMAAVDGRGDADEFGEAPTTASPTPAPPVRSSLWQPPSPDSTSSTGGAADAPRPESKAPPADPDRTQPMQPIDRPDGDDGGGDDDTRSS